MLAICPLVLLLLITAAVLAVVGVCTSAQRKQPGGVQTVAGKQAVQVFQQRICMCSNRVANHQSGFNLTLWVPFDPLPRTGVPMIIWVAGPLLLATWVVL